MAEKVPVSRLRIENMPKPTILIIEDIASLSLAYAGDLESAGFQSIIVDSLSSANEQLSGQIFDAILLDLQLPDGNGLDWLNDNQDIVSRNSIIVATADGSINRAIEAMRLGAYDFMVKPLAPARLVAAVKSAVLNKASEAPAETKKVTAAQRRGFAGFVGNCPPMQTIYKQIENISRSKATIFITGESGTGKEVCADAIHSSGPRAKKPFIAINCGAIPEDLMESELFGHLKGSFTGAISDRVGAVQAAHGGTLFLDEICEMALKLQVKLLRFIQTGTVQRVGSTKTENVDVRIICATNRNPLTEVKAGRFREDLYYRLAVVPIELPPLRARGDDILLLANEFLDRYANEEGKRFTTMEPALVQALHMHRWPGNVRELQNLMRRSAVMCDGPVLGMEILPEFVAPHEIEHVKSQPLQINPANLEAAAMQAIESANKMAALTNMDWMDGRTLDQIEQMVVEQAIVKCGGSVTKAAKTLDVSPSTLYRKREKWMTDKAIETDNGIDIDHLNKFA